MARIADLPLHPAILALAVVLAFWTDQPVSPYSGIRLLPAAALVAIALTVACWAVLRNRHRAGLVVSGLFALAWTKHIVRLGADVLPHLDLVRGGVLLVLLLLTGALALRIAIRHASAIWRSPQITPRLNAIAALLLGVTVLGGAATGRMSAVAVDIGAQNGSPSGTALAAATHHPDIYVFLLDMYARADVLEERYGYDNEWFLDGLESREFSVSSDSRSAYAYTHQALPALLHMAYQEQIPTVDAVYAGHAPVRPTLRLAINQNPVFELLRSRGYEIHSVNSGFEDYSIRHVEQFHDTGELNEFELQFLESTFVGEVVAAVAPDLASGALRSRIHSTLETASEIAATPSDRSRLVFVHVPAPHTPIVLGPAGEPIQAPLDADFFRDRHVSEGADPGQFAVSYRGEVAYLNGLVLNTLDAVLARSEEPPVVLVLSDHGPSSGIDWDETPRDQLPEAALRERIGNLFAARTPSRANVFPNDVVIVDVFRHLFDAYFGTELGPATPPSDGAHFTLP